MAILHQDGFGPIEIFVVDATPNGSITAPRGSYAYDTASNAAYCNVDAGTTWKTLNTTYGILGAVPDANYDIADGAVVGDQILDTSNFFQWFCADNSLGAAAWMRLMALALSQSGAPTATDDEDLGWQNGSLWGVEKALYMCRDKTSTAAVWDCFLDATGAIDFAVNGKFRATFDFAAEGGVVGDIPFGPELPDNAYVTLAYYQVLTDFASPNGPNNATVGMGVTTNDAAGLVGALAINNGGNEFLTAGGSIKACTPDATVGNFTQQTTDRRRFNVTVGIENITAGKLVLWGDYGTTE